jgi:uncharacterized LabA/DUF88 family protein
LPPERPKATPLAALSGSSRRVIYVPQIQPFDQRVGIFIDVQNMFYAAKHLYGSKLNFTQLLDYVSRGRLTRAISYIIKTPEIDQSNFITMLRSNGYEVRVKDLKQRPDGSAKGDWDMGLALDALA